MKTNGELFGRKPTESISEDAKDVLSVFALVEEVQKLKPTMKRKNIFKAVKIMRLNDISNRLQQ